MIQDSKPIPMTMYTHRDCLNKVFEVFGTGEVHPYHWGKLIQDALSKLDQKTCSIDDVRTISEVTERYFDIKCGCCGKECESVILPDLWYVVSGVPVIKSTGEGLDDGVDYRICSDCFEIKRKAHYGH